MERRRSLSCLALVLGTVFAFGGWAAAQSALPGDSSPLVVEPFLEGPEGFVHAILMDPAELFPVHPRLPPGAHPFTPLSIDGSVRAAEAKLGAGAVTALAQGVGGSSRVSLSSMGGGRTRGKTRSARPALGELASVSHLLGMR